jgi:hypothetical protein
MARRRFKVPVPDLPEDLVEFLGTRKQLEYDPKDCEAGKLTLFRLSELMRELFPVETSGSPIFEQDPRYPEVNSYLVPAVGLTKACSASYEPTGLLLWLPVEKRYGIWDSSHCTISMFGPDVTWTNIVAAPAAHINAGWCRSGSPQMTPLVPWPAHEYGDEQIYEPIPEC